MNKRNLPPLPLKVLQTRKCGSESMFVDQMDVQKELKSLTSRALASDNIATRRPFFTARESSLTGYFSKAEKAGCATNYPEHDDSDSSDDENMEDDAKPNRDLTAELMVFRCSSPYTPRRSSRLHGHESAGCVSRQSSSRSPRGPRTSSSYSFSGNLAVAQPRREISQDVDLVNQRPFHFEELLDQRAIRNSFRCWRADYMERLTLTQPIIDQYSACCSFLKRSAFLKTQLRRFLIRSSSAHMELSGCGLSNKDVTAFFCALVGRGCDLKSTTRSIQEIRLEQEDVPLSSIDLSSNKLGSEGVSALTKVLISSNFLSVRPPLPLGSVHGLVELDLSRNGLGVAGATAVEALVASRACSIRRLVVTGNMFGDLGCASLLRGVLSNSSLHHLDLTDNGAAQAAGIALAAVLEANSTLESLGLAYNHLRGAGARRIGHSLGKNKTLRKLDLQWNGFGDDETMADICKSIPDFCVEELNLAHNRIKLQGACILAGCLESGSSLRELILDGNLLGQIGARMLHRAAEKAPLKSGRDFATVLQMANCGIHVIDHQAFDPCEPAGPYTLDMRDAYDRTILINLIRSSLNGSGSFVHIRVNGKTTNFNAVANGSQCTICDNSSIDPADWCIRTPSGICLPVEQMDGPDGQPMPISKTWAKLLSRPEDQLTCLVQLTFKSELRRPLEDAKLSARNFAMLEKVFGDAGATSDSCEEAMDLVLASDTFISVDQVNQLLSLLLNEDDPIRKSQLSGARVSFVARCFHKVVDSERNTTVFEKLENADEKVSIERTLGSASFDFTPNNPTGYYRLDLSERVQREICLRLLEIKNGMQEREEQIRAFYSSRKAGGRREGPEDSQDLERTWRNSKLDGEVSEFKDGWKIPHRGILELDFVHVAKPRVGRSGTVTPPIRLFDQVIRQDAENSSKRISKFRRISNRELFTCEQVAKILQSFNESELRVEVCIIAYARIVDWHGFRNLIFLLNFDEHKLLQKRLGYINLFNDVMAVDYYELDLSHCGDRFILQELLHLAAVEPGENILDCTYNGIDFKPPAFWLKDVPRTGLICFCYCREQRVIEKIFETGSWDNSGSPFHCDERGEPFGSTAWSDFSPRWIREYCEQKPAGGPVPCPQPHDGRWVRPHKIRYIKMKMLAKFADPRMMFSAMDRDGGGSLDRKELAMGLFALGIWLCPSELQILLDTLDKDGGGDVDIDEFTAFWNKYSFD